MAYYNDYSDPQIYDFMPDQYRYRYSYEPKQPPPPDKNWIDPVPVVRNYLDRIHQDCIQEEFRDIKETYIYLMEVLVGGVELEKDVIPNPLELKQLKAKIKFPTLDFLNIDDENSANLISSMQHRKSKIVPSYTDLFQNILETGNHKGRKSQLTNQDEQSDTKVKHEQNFTPPEVNQANTELPSTNKLNDGNTLELNRGKSVLVTMPGLKMIQSLQRQPVIVHVTVMQLGDTDDVLTEVEAVVRLPESFRQAVLKASMPNTTLPLSAAISDYHPLLTTGGSKVGDAELTLTITCLGYAVVNSIHGVGPEIYKHNNAVFLKTLKPQSKGADESHDLSPSPENWKIVFKSSEEILSSCQKVVDVKTNLYPPKNCFWFKMAQNAIPKEPEVGSIQIEEPDYLQLAMWGEHRRKCKKILEDNTHRPSTLDLLDSLLKKEGLL